MMALLDVRKVLKGSVVLDEKGAEILKFMDILYGVIKRNDPTLLKEGHEVSVLFGEGNAKDCRVRISTNGIYFNSPGRDEVALAGLFRGWGRGSQSEKIPMRELVLLHDALPEILEVVMNASSSVKEKLVFMMREAREA